MCCATLRGETCQRPSGNRSGALTATAPLTEHVRLDQSFAGRSWHRHLCVCCGQVARGCAVASAPTLLAAPPAGNAGIDKGAEASLTISHLPVSEEAVASEDADGAADCSQGGDAAEGRDEDGATDGRVATAAAATPP